MALGKLGAFLNKDMGALVKDAGKLLTADVGTLAKSAGRVLQSDLGELLRAAPETEKPAIKVADVADAVPVSLQKQVAPIPTPTAPAFDPDVTQKMDQASVAAAPFDPDVTQKMDMTNAVSAQAAPAIAVARVDDSAATLATEIAKFNLELLLRTQRNAPTGNEVLVLLPYIVGEFERPHATPSGELTNDPVNAVYAGRAESVQVQLALCWDDDEALERVDEMLGKIGQAARTTSDRTWVMGPTPQGVAFAWTRGSYYFCATSTKGVNALARFLSAYPF